MSDEKEVDRQLQLLNWTLFGHKDMPGIVTQTRVNREELDSLAAKSSAINTISQTRKLAVASIAISALTLVSIVVRMFI